MSGKDFSAELEVALRAVQQAAYLCRNVQAGLNPDVLEKRDRSPVTVADFGSQALICKSLSEAFPGDRIVAEEDSRQLRKPENEALVARILEHMAPFAPGAEPAQLFEWLDLGGDEGKSGRFWCLDPIDGTKGFLRGDQYAVSLALLEDGEVVLGALGCPNFPFQSSAKNKTGQIFYAVRGKGAFVQDLDLKQAPQPVQVNPLSDPAQARFCESFESSHSSHSDSQRISEILGIQTAPVRLDSQAKYAVVASGLAEIYLRLPTRADYREKIWDHAAGYLVIREAGGKVTDISGAELDFSAGRELRNNRGVVATNGALHDAVLGAVRQAGIV
ncbi:MAG TPA: 3'(2'),5'-bisphosphate nucleotidase [Bacteroidetes bacterium]|nr:3'(2'),5'-bisphosphate nucleotidase [Bacteroidota bacterium]